MGNSGLTIYIYIYKSAQTFSNSSQTQDEYRRVLSKVSPCGNNYASEKGKFFSQRYAFRLKHWM